MLKNYEIMFNKSCKLSQDIVNKYNNDNEFKKENDKLEKMINNKSNSNEISKQHQIVIQKIKNNEDLTKELKTFTDNINVCGSVGSCMANVFGYHNEAKHINNITSSAIQLTTISSAFNGLGPMASMGPNALSAMAIVTVLNTAMSLFNNDEGTSPFIALHEMLTSIMNSITGLKEEMKEYFRKLDIKLDKIEANIIKHIIENFDMNYENQCILKQLCKDNLRFQEYTISSLENINNNINSLKNQIIQSETNQIIISIGNLISKIYCNLDITKVSDYSNELTGKLLHPYECTHIALTGEYQQFNENSVFNTSKLVLIPNFFFTPINKDLEERKEKKLISLFRI